MVDLITLGFFMSFNPGFYISTYWYVYPSTRISIYLSSMSVCQYGIAFVAITSLVSKECSPMAQETGIQSLVESYQRIKKWYLMSPCLTLSIISYGSRVKWSNPGKGVAPSPTPWDSSYRKSSLRVPLDYGRQLYFLLTSPVLIVVLIAVMRRDQGTV